ncbi:rab proteins geranylgeranyltransferase component A 2-like isoform X3 [Stegodyphus dumicola]|uniref:rab proteins geranylgeranyltransferase component A 2-like isoform X3 n=2 Tax=Stegodyphus dumicola TaxID=202533 RepID=UPI0015B21CD5|nr:rab proteins geranylgeranyltransferase component A 2-like isoform X3 [Stegodyphus dumicola]
MLCLLMYDICRIDLMKYESLVYARMYYCSSCSQSCNGYYGGDWASFSFDKFLEWIDEAKVDSDNLGEHSNESSPISSFVNENENFVLCLPNSKSVTNICLKSYIRDEPCSPVTLNAEINELLNNTESEASHSSDDQPVNVAPSTDSVQSEADSEETLNSSSQNDTSSPDTNNADNQPVSIVDLQQEWSIRNFLENRRKFNIDLAPKIMFSRGSLVELLITSNIARYAEFQCVNRVLTYINGHLEQVPCSRADVFSTKNVTVVEKRMLMKFLTFCLKFEEQEEEYRGFENGLFVDFLKSKKLTPNVEHYIIHAIAMVDESCNTLEGLKASQKFLESLGRYGKSPFLCTCYGSAELPQCFCRLCAVYEGMYYLKRKAEAVVLSNNHCCGIISMGQRINCQWLVMESSYAPPEFLPPAKPEYLSRGIFITDASLYPSEKNENILLKLPPGPGITNPITVLEFSSKTYVCPEDLYIVYMVGHSSNTTAEEDLKYAVELLFRSEASGNEVPNGSTNHKPNILWCLYYNQKDTSTIDLNFCVPGSIFLTSSPDVQLDYEHSVKEAREIFNKICPGEEFLPRAPDPEDILIDQHNNPGDDGNGGKIENDVSKSDSGFTESSYSNAEIESTKSLEENHSTLGNQSLDNAETEGTKSSEENLTATENQSLESETG